MKKIVCRLRCAAVLAASFLCAAAAYALTRFPVFGGDKYEFSRSGSSSASIERAENAFFYKLFTPVAGESARWAGDVHGELLDSFRAEVLFTEEACGVVNYYCRSPYLGAGIALNGVRVNLHIAVGCAETAAGTPVIFGGY